MCRGGVGVRCVGERSTVYWEISMTTNEFSITFFSV